MRVRLWSAQCSHFHSVRKAIGVSFPVEDSRRISEIGPQTGNEEAAGGGSLSQLPPRLHRGQKWLRLLQWNPDAGNRGENHYASLENEQNSSKPANRCWKEGLGLPLITIRRFLLFSQTNFNVKCDAKKWNEEDLYEYDSDLWNGFLRTPLWIFHYSSSRSILVSNLDLALCQTIHIDCWYNYSSINNSSSISWRLYLSKECFFRT